MEFSNWLDPLKKFFGFDDNAPDISDEWPERGKQMLVLDLNRMSLNSVLMRDLPERLYEFGRPSNRQPFKNECFQYDKTGCLVEIYDGTVGYFAVCIQQDEYTPFGPAYLEVICPSGPRFTVTETTVQAEIHEWIGLPYVSDVDDKEIVDFFGLGEYTLEVEYWLDKTVKRINLYEGNVEGNFCHKETGF